MPVYHVELLIHETQQVAIQAENEDLAIKLVRAGIGHWIDWPSSVIETKIKREISTEEWEAIKNPRSRNPKQGV